MAFNAPFSLLVLAARLLVSSGDYIAELTSYTESVILQLALSQPGTFECVLFDMHKQHPFEVVLGDLMRSPKLGHVVKNDPTLLLICGLERFNLHKANRWEKLILLSLIIFFFLVTNAYETKIISLMSSKPSFRTIQTIEELVTSGTPTKADFKKLIQMDLSPFKGTVVNSSDKLVSMDGVSAYLATRTKSKLYLPIFYFDYNLQRNTYVILDDHLGMLIGAFLTSNHNPLQEMLEWSERAFFEGGLLNFYTAHFQLESVHAMQKFRPRTAAKLMLTIDDLLPAWLSLAVGTVASGLLFCGELLIGRCKKPLSAARRKIVGVYCEALLSCYLVARAFWAKFSSFDFIPEIFNKNRPVQRRQRTKFDEHIKM
ncbi:hypothetical protein pipiens_010934 [Culex pipiens pipiens]|uniref:Ionotropic receptor n=1 Tax=Culex pipiens pipiens TaxID=38569 RepID=A0ABD1D930_CULPP